MSKKALQWETVKVKVSDLVPLEINPRDITEAAQSKLLELLDKFNIVEIPVINTDNKLITFNQRLKILMLAGRGNEEIEARKPNRKLTAAEVKEYALVSNNHQGTWNIDILRAEFSDIDFKALGIDIPGFTDLLTDPEDDFIVGEPAEDEDFDTTPPPEPITVKGDLYTIGPHRIFCGDSTSADDWAVLMNNELADIIVTDPPYNVNYEGKTADALKIINDKQSPENFYNFLYDFFTAAFMYTKPGGPIYVYHANLESVNFHTAFTAAGWLLKQVLIWVKNTMVIGRSDYHWKHEPCIYGWRPGAAHYFTDDRTQTTVIDDKQDFKKLSKKELIKQLETLTTAQQQTTVIYEDKPARSELHPTIKPVKLFARHINNSSRPGCIVVDPFIGSGTTLLTADQLGRKCYAMDLDPRFIDVTIKRILNFNPTYKVYRSGDDVTNDFI